MGLALRTAIPKRSALAFQAITAFYGITALWVLFSRSVKQYLVFEENDLEEKKEGDEEKDIE